MFSNFNIKKYIGIGQENARTAEEISKMCGLTPRVVRELISKERRETCILNMQDGQGYFIPTKKLNLLLNGRTKRRADSSRLLLPYALQERLSRRHRINERQFCFL